MLTKEYALRRQSQIVEKCRYIFGRKDIDELTLWPSDAPNPIGKLIIWKIPAGLESDLKPFSPKILACSKMEKKGEKCVIF